MTTAADAGWKDGNVTKKYAPGPWWISDNGSDMRPEAIHCNGCNAIVATTWAIVPEEMRKASAALIAASPELLESLRELFALEVMPDNFQERQRQEMLTKARAAIAKAEGVAA